MLVLSTEEEKLILALRAAGMHPMAALLGVRSGLYRVPQFEPVIEKLDQFLLPWMEGDTNA